MPKPHSSRRSTEQDNQATQEVQRVRSLISEHENGSEICMPSPSTVPSAVLVGLYQFLQTTGLDYQQMAHVAALLGAAVPPTPPPPVQATGISPLQAKTELPGNLPTAQPLEAHPGDNAARTPEQTLKHQAVMAMQQQGLAHPTHLASQLLGSRPAAHAGDAPLLAHRQGWSPAPKRKLPGRTGEADSGRSASRTPDRGAQNQAPVTPRTNTGALSPTLPHPGAMPSSLQGVAPPSWTACHNADIFR